MADDSDDSLDELDLDNIDVSLASAGKIGKKGRRVSRISSIKIADDVALQEWGTWQLARDSIDVDREIGQGAHGYCNKGIMHGRGANEGMKAYVAIKTMKPGHEDAVRDTLAEAMLMINLRHSNIVNIYGVCTLKQPIMIVSELCEHGDLLNFLDSEMGEQLTYPKVFQLIEEVSYGMEYMEECCYIHRDLACRNVLVEDKPTSANLVRCKVADFGLTVDQGHEGFWQGDINTPVAIRWTAPEAIQRAHFSNKSDVWSFGITVYEIIGMGREPYEGAKNKEVVTMVIKEGARLPMPSAEVALKGCPQNLHDLMMKCWALAPDARPSFDEIANDLLPDIAPQ